MTLTPSPAPVEQTSFGRNVNLVQWLACEQQECVYDCLDSDLGARSLCVVFLLLCLFLMNNVFVSQPRNHLGINDEPCWKLTGCFAQLSQNKLPRRSSENKCGVLIYLQVCTAPSVKVHSRNSLKRLKWISILTSILL